MHYSNEGDKMIDQRNLKQFEKIYDETYNTTLKYVICKCSNLDDVNDIIQETYLEFYKSLKQQKQINNYRKYIIGIASNKIKKHYNFLSRIKTIPLFSDKDNDLNIVDTIPNNIDLEEIIIKCTNNDLIWKYLKTKKIIIQKVFYLYYELDLTIKDISQQLKVSESYTKNCLYRTLKELQNFLRKDCD